MGVGEVKPGASALAEVLARRLSPKAQTGT
jgi:hypothetical protein